jgi:hypothetical protein
VTLNPSAITNQPLLGRVPLGRRIPFVFEQFYFRRWITSCHLYKRIPPALTITGAGR